MDDDFLASYICKWDYVRQQSKQHTLMIIGFWKDAAISRAYNLNDCSLKVAGHVSVTSRQQTQPSPSESYALSCQFVDFMLSVKPFSIRSTSYTCHKHDIKKRKRRTVIVAMGSDSFSAVGDALSSWSWLLPMTAFWFDCSRGKYHIRSCGVWRWVQVFHWKVGRVEDNGSGQGGGSLGHWRHCLLPSEPEIDLRRLTCVNVYRPTTSTGDSYMERNMTCILVYDLSIKMLMLYLIQRVKYHNDNNDNERERRITMKAYGEWPHALAAIHRAAQWLSMVLTKMVSWIWYAIKEWHDGRKRWCVGATTSLSLFIICALWAWVILLSKIMINVCLWWADRLVRELIRAVGHLLQLTSLHQRANVHRCDGVHARSRLPWHVMIPHSLTSSIIDDCDVWINTKTMHKNKGTIYKHMLDSHSFSKIYQRTWKTKWPIRGGPFGYPLLGALFLMMNSGRDPLLLSRLFAQVWW